MGRKRLYAGVVMLSCALMFAGCNLSKEENTEVLVSEGSERTYEMTKVQRGDIQKTKVIVANYQQVKSENLFFKADRRALAGVYVSKGDTVKKGDLLAEVQCESEKKQLTELEYNISTQEMKITHLREQLDLELVQLEKKKGSMSGTAYDQKVTELKKKYQLQIENIEDQIYIQKMQYDELYEWLQGCYIYATMDGTVTFMAELGSDFVSWSGNKVFTVSAAGECAFLCDETDYFSYFKKGETYVLTTSSALEYETTLTEIDTNAGVMYFVPTVPQHEMPLGQRVLYSLVLEEKENVLYVPKSAVHYVGGETYIYYFDSAGDRQIKKIEGGLEADSKVEIVSGLAEGDELILR